MSTTDTTATAAPPAAWYPDPTGKHALRWWDGTAWTTRVAEGETEVAPAEEPTDFQSDFGAEAEAEEEPAERDPMAGVDTLRRDRVPPAERPTTGAGLDHGPGRQTVILMIVGVAIVAVSLLWGYHNYDSANRWRDRGEALTEELETRASNADAIEQALAEAASRQARLGDSQEQMTELREATELTVDQLRQCASILNNLLNYVGQGGSDPTGLINQANNACNSAVTNGEQLIAIVNALNVE